MPVRVIRSSRTEAATDSACSGALAAMSPPDGRPYPTSKVLASQPHLMWLACQKLYLEGLSEALRDRDRVPAGLHGVHPYAPDTALRQGEGQRRGGVVPSLRRTGRA